jgi:hypothetical protein
MLSCLIQFRLIPFRLIPTNYIIFHHIPSYSIIFQKFHTFLSTSIITSLDIAPALQCEFQWSGRTTRRTISTWFKQMNLREYQIIWNVGYLWINRSWWTVIWGDVKWCEVMHIDGYIHWWMFMFVDPSAARLNSMLLRIEWTVKEWWRMNIVKKWEKNRMWMKLQYFYRFAFENFDVNAFQYWKILNH